MCVAEYETAWDSPQTQRYKDNKYQDLPFRGVKFSHQQSQPDFQRTHTAPLKDMPI